MLVLAIFPCTVILQEPADSVRFLEVKSCYCQTAFLTCAPTPPSGSAGEQTLWWVHARQTTALQPTQTPASEAHRQGHSGSPSLAL